MCDRRKAQDSVFVDLCGLLRANCSLNSISLYISSFIINSLSLGPIRSHVTVFFLLLNSSRNTFVNYFLYLFVAKQNYPNKYTNKLLIVFLSKKFKSFLLRHERVHARVLLYFFFSLLLCVPSFKNNQKKKISSLFFSLSFSLFSFLFYEVQSSPFRIMNFLCLCDFL